MRKISRVTGLWILVILVVLDLTSGLEDEEIAEETTVADDEPAEVRESEHAAHFAYYGSGPTKRFRKKGAPHILEHFGRSGEWVVPHRAHSYNSHPRVAEMQTSAPPRVSFKRSNFGVQQTITHLANLTFAVNGRDRGDVLIGLFGKAAPKLVANFRALIQNGEQLFTESPFAGLTPIADSKRNDPTVKLVGSRCVRLAPEYIVQCGDFGPQSDQQRENLTDVEYRHDDGIDETDFSAYLDYVSRLRSRAALRENDNLQSDTINVDAAGLQHRHQIGTISMVVRNGKVGSHFFLSATGMNYEFDGQHAPIGIILSGYTTVLERSLMREVPIDLALFAPRHGAEVTVSRAWIRRFVGKGLTLEYEQKYQRGAEEIVRLLRDNSNSDPTDVYFQEVAPDNLSRHIHPDELPKPSKIRTLPGVATESTLRMRGWILPVPGSVRAKLFAKPFSAEELRQKRIREQRETLALFDRVFQKEGPRGLKRLQRSKTQRRSS